MARATPRVAPVLDAVAAPDSLRGAEGPFDAAVAAVRLALYDAATQIRVALLDDGGSLRSVVSWGARPPSQRLRSARRRAALADGRAIVRTGRDGSDALVPLFSGGEAVGVLEVSAPPRELVTGLAMLEAIGAQVATVARALRYVERSHAEARWLRAMPALAASVLRAREPSAVLDPVLRFVLRRTDRPVAAWLGAGDRLWLAGTRGFPAQARQTLRAWMPVLPAWRALPDRDRDAVTEAFCSIAGSRDTRRVGIVESGGALVLSAGPIPPTVTAGLAEIVGEAMTRAEVLARALRREREFDLGVAATAHELRAPIAGARSAIEAALTGSADADDLLARAARELAEAGRAVDGLLRVGSRPVVRVQPVDLGELVRDLSAAIDRRRIHVRPTSAVRVAADADLLRSAVGNLLRNALAYSPPAGVVRVAVESMGRSARISVSDDGPGIPPSERGSIFDPFVRGRSRRGGRRGAGLGLFISRRVVEAHGGSIWVEPAGKGSTFRIELPRSLGGIAP